MPPADRTPFAPHPKGLTLAVRLQPGARQAGLEGLAELADGRQVLKVKVSEPAEAGRANRALIKLLAKAWRLPKSRVTLLSGASQRRKTLLIAGDPGALAAQLEAWLKTTGR